MISQAASDRNWFSDQPAANLRQPPGRPGMVHVRLRLADLDLRLPHRHLGALIRSLAGFRQQFFWGYLTDFMQRVYYMTMELPW